MGRMGRMGSLGRVRGSEDGQVQVVWRLGRFACQRLAHKEAVLAIAEHRVGPVFPPGAGNSGVHSAIAGTDAFPPFVFQGGPSWGRNDLDRAVK